MRILLSCADLSTMYGTGQVFRSKEGSTMKLQRMKAAAVAVLFLIAGVLYSAGRSQDIFLYESAQVSEEDNWSDSIGETKVQKTQDLGKEQGSAQSDGSAASESGTAKGEAGDAELSDFQESEEMLLHVHVCGAVKNAGVYLLSEGSIVQDAIDAAGGAVKDGAVDYLNLAGTVSEGDKIYVPFLKEVESLYGDAGPIGQSSQETGVSSSNTDAAQRALVNLNTASKEQLMTLSGIGETRADAILAYREANGRFQTIEDVMKVSGIKEGAFAKIKDQITV